MDKTCSFDWFPFIQVGAHFPNINTLTIQFLSRKKPCKLTVYCDLHNFGQLFCRIYHTALKHPITSLLVILLLVASVQCYPYMSPGDSNGIQIHRLSYNQTRLKDEDLDINLRQLVEGDILVPASRYSSNYEIARQAPIIPWPRGIIPYYIDPHFNAQQQSIIRQAIDAFHRYTCIRFKPYAGERDYVHIVGNGYGCNSYIGRIGGRQVVNLQANACLTQKGVAMHELMHVVGFEHEQSRPDRNYYVRILWNNIQPAMKHNFNEISRINTFGLGYDYYSLMHYNYKAFSINGQPTILPLNSRIAPHQLGQINGFTSYDIAKIQRMYNCAQG